MLLTALYVPPNIAIHGTWLQLENTRAARSVLVNLNVASINKFTGLSAMYLSSHKLKKDFFKKLTLIDLSFQNETSL